jgi:hypothetical protein
MINKMKACFLVFTIFTISFCSIAQEELVKKIRDDYVDYNKKSQQLESDGINKPFKINTVQIRPALGPVEIEMAYYFDEENKDIASDGMDTRKATAILRKIVYKESMPSYTDYREVFFDSGGNLSFYYSKLTGYSCGEKRFYFSLSKLIKVKFNPIEGNDCFGEKNDEKFPDFTRYSGKFSKEDLDWEKWIVKYVVFHKKAFQNLFESLQQ